MVFCECCCFWRMCVNYHFYNMQAYLLQDSANALSIPTTHLNARLIGLLSLAFVFMLHSTKLTWGLRLQNSLGVMKFILLLSIALAGFLSLFDIPGFQLSEGQKPHNFDTDTLWDGTRVEVNAFVTALYNVIWYPYCARKWMSLFLYSNS